MKYTDKIVEHIGLLDGNKKSNETEDFQICSKKIWEMLEFLKKLDIKLNWHLALKKYLPLLWNFTIKKWIFYA